MMNKRINRLVAIGGVVLVGAALLFALSVFAQEPKKDNQMMSMENMMKGCKEHCQKTMTSIDRTTTTMAQARQSNDTAQMRSALEQGEKALAEMKDHMSMCMNMMNMMHPKGTTKGSTKKRG